MPSKSGGPTASAADTKTAIISSYTIPRSGTVKQIRVSSYNGVADKAGSGILHFESDQNPGPNEFAISSGAGLTDVYSHPTDVINCNIPVSKGELITISTTFAEAEEEVCVSFTWV